MDSAKIQSEIIAEIIKRRDNNDRPVMFDDMGGTPYIGIITSPYYAYVIIRSDFMINPGEMRSTTIMTGIYTNSYSAKPIEWNGKTQTKTITALKKKKSVLVELVNEENEVVLIKSEYINKFGKIDNLQFKQNKKNSPVFVYDKKTDCLIGYIMPIMNRV